jgi:hypothetical protein
MGQRLRQSPILVRTGKVKTAPPPRGAERGTPPAAPEEIRAALAKELAELPKQAADEAGNIESLQQQVRNLTRELTHVKRGQPEPVKETIRVLVPDVELGKQERARGIRIIRQLQAMATRIERDAQEIVTYAEAQTADEMWAETKYLPERIEQNSGGKITIPRGGDLVQQTTRIDWVDGRTDEHTRLVELPPRHHKEPTAALQRATRDVELQPRGLAKSNGELPRGALKMLKVLAQRPSNELTRAQLGTLDWLRVQWRHVWRIPADPQARRLRH